MQHPSLDVLKYRAMPEVASALRAVEEEVLAHWRANVLQTLPAADELTMQQLEDHLPMLIDKIAAALEASEPHPTNELIAISPVHGETRFHQNFNLNELLIEYHLLRRVMLEHVTRELGRDLDLQEAVALNVGLDTALRRSVVAFSEYQAIELKSE